MASIAPSTSAGRADHERQVRAPLVVLQPIEQGGAVVGPIVLAAADPGLQAQAVAVVDQQADDAGVLLQAPAQLLVGAQLPLLADRRHRPPGRHAPAPRPASPGPGRGRRCGPGTPARPAARPSTGWRRWTIRPDPPAATRPAPGPAATTGDGPRRPAGPASGWSSRHSSSRSRVASRAAPPRSRRASPAGSSSRVAAGSAARDPPQQPAVLQVEHHRRRDAGQAGGLAAGAQQGDRRLVDGLRQLRVGQMPLVRAQAQRASLRRRRRRRSSADGLRKWSATPSPERRDSRWMTSTSSSSAAAPAVAAASSRSGSSPSSMHDEPAIRLQRPGRR